MLPPGTGPLLDRLASDPGAWPHRAPTWPAPVRALRRLAALVCHRRGPEPGPGAVVPAPVARPVAGVGPPAGPGR
jgi:hypothetical protein